MVCVYYEVKKYNFFYVSNTIGIILSIDLSR